AARVAAVGRRGRGHFDGLSAERVSARVHGADEARRTRTVGERAAKLGDEDAEVRVDDEGPRPQLGVQGVLVHDVGPVLDEQPQQVERLGRQVDLYRALPAEPTGLGVERELGEVNLHGNANLQKPWNSPTTGAQSPV